MKRNLFFLLLASTLALSSCSSLFKVEVLVDNPTDQALQLVLDDELYDLGPKSIISINLVKGEHSVIAYLADKESYNGTIMITSPSLLNLCKGTYVLHKEIYLADQSQYDAFAEEALNLQDVVIQDKTYQQVDFEVYRETDVLIPNHWDYNVNEELPEEIKTNNDDYAVVSKLYRVEALEKSWGFYGNFDFTGNSDEELQQFLDSINNSMDTISVAN